jgi:hypothetical protein
MIQVPRDPNEKVNFYELRNLLKECYDLSISDKGHLDPAQVMQKLKDHD